MIVKTFANIKTRKRRTDMMTKLTIDTAITNIDILLNILRGNEDSSTFYEYAEAFAESLYTAKRALFKYREETSN